MLMAYGVEQGFATRISILEVKAAKTALALARGE